MTKTIRLIKGKENLGRAWAFGFTNAAWVPNYNRYRFGNQCPYIDITEGDIIDKTTRKPVPVEDIVKVILEDNRETITQTDQFGRNRKPVYGEDAKWYVDYNPELDEFFYNNHIPLPSDKRSFGERLKDQALNNLKAQGFNFDIDADKGAGQKKLAAAKQAELEKEMLELKRQIASLTEEKKTLVIERKSKKNGEPITGEDK